MEEYSGIYQEIVERIERGNGEADVEAVTSELTSLFGVSEKSVQSYLAGPSFLIEMGKVSMAIEEDYIGKDPTPIENSCATDLGWGQRVIIDDSHMKGYSIYIFADIAHANGISRPWKRDTDVDCSMLKRKPWEKKASVIWSISQNSHKVLIGRLREFLERDGFSPGDVLVIVPTPECVYLLPPSVEGPSCF